MKKIYALALSAALSLPAMAQVASFEKNDSRHEIGTFKQATKLNNEGLVMKSKAPAKVAATVADVVGDYKIGYYVELVNGGYYSSEMTVTEGTTPSTVVLNIPYENNGYTYIWSLEGTLDTSTGTITILADQTCNINNATISFERFDYDAYDYVTLSSVTATYTGTGIEFDEDDGLGLLASGGGYYTFFDYITMTKIIDDPNADPNEGWTSLGNATFVDPWVATGIGLDESKSTWEVELQQNDADENVYRLVDPYKGSSPVAAYNQSTAAHGYIQFNISDPDHVYFDIVEAGFANSNLGVTEMYCYNNLGWAIAYLNYQYAPSIIVQVFGDDLVYTTYKDGVVTLGSKTDEDGDTEYDAMFGIQGATTAGYCWTDADDNAVPMLGSITFPNGAGVEGVEVDDADAPVKYYNLQGVQVSEPSAGQLVIRVQGEKATKMVVR